MLPVRVRRRGDLAERRAMDQPTNWMQQMFDWMSRPWGFEAGSWVGTYPVDVREEAGKVVVDAELPGFKPDEIDVSVDRGVLHILAERKPEQPKGTAHLSERRYTRVERSFTLPADIDVSKDIQAHLENGVLHIELPETEESRPRQIKVQ